MGQPPDIKPPKQPRRFRFSMRTLLIVFALISAGLAIFVYVVAQTGIGRAIAQSRDMSFLKDHGVRVEFADPTAEQEKLLNYLPREGVLTPIQARSAGKQIDVDAVESLARIPSWESLSLDVDRVSDDALHQLLSSSKRLDYLGLRGTVTAAAIPSFAEHDALVYMELDLPNCDSSLLSAIAGAPSLEVLTFSAGISDEGLVEILEMPTLEEFHLRDNAEVTNAPFIAAKSPGIESLGVINTQFGDEGFKAVIRWPAIRSVFVAGTQITDAAFREIPAESTSQLRHLNIGNTTVTSAALPDIAAFSGLTYLDVSETAVGDDNLEQLNKLPALDFLVMTNCKITDAGLMKLQSKTLRVLWLQGTQVTAAGFADLKVRLPALEQLFLLRTNITAAEAEKLRARYPNVQFDGL